MLETPVFNIHSFRKFIQRPLKKSARRSSQSNRGEKRKLWRWYNIVQGF